jgi:hypothetical protein
MSTIGQQQCRRFLILAAVKLESFIANSFAAWEAHPTGIVE